MILENCTNNKFEFVEGKNHFLQNFDLRHIGGVGGIVHIALLQIVDDVLVLLTLDWQVAKMHQMRG